MEERTGPSTACSCCLAMSGDAVAAKKGSGEAKRALEVVDVVQLDRSIETGKHPRSWRNCLSGFYLIYNRQSPNNGCPGRHSGRMKSESDPDGLSTPDQRGDPAGFGVCSVIAAISG
jgi:hypothetical protein